MVSSLEERSLEGRTLGSLQVSNEAGDDSKASKPNPNEGMKGAFMACSLSLLGQ